MKPITSVWASTNPSHPQGVCGTITTLLPMGTPLYSEEQLRAVQVQVLRKAAKHNYMGIPGVSILNNMANEIEENN